MAPGGGIASVIHIQSSYGANRAHMMGPVVPRNVSGARGLPPTANGLEAAPIAPAEEFGMAAFGWSKTRLVVAGGTAAAIAATAMGVAYAQTPTATPTREQRAEDHLNRFAQNLGVDAAKVKEALKQTALQHIDEAVAAGRLTAEQAQKAKDAINSGQFPMGPGGFGFKGGPGGKGGPGMGGDHRGPGGPGMGGDHRGPGGPGMMGVAHEALATFLGVTPEQLRTEMQGKSLKDVAAAHGKSADDLKAFITTTATTKANEAVAAGKLTQDQATKMLDMLKANLDTMIGMQMPAFGPGGPGGQGGFGGFGGPRGQRGQGIPQQQATPSTTPGTSF